MKTRTQIDEYPYFGSGRRRRVVCQLRVCSSCSSSRQIFRQTLFAGWDCTCCGRFGCVGGTAAAGTGYFLFLLSLLLFQLSYSISERFAFLISVERSSFLR
uniref:(northern house mosquito) hypothetical protein n=1 Tax=Culex pipiens TaxID=7175 RepID=A0A8D8A1X5_CULPI